MKLTKSQLNQIVREEYALTLEERQQLEELLGFGQIVGWLKGAYKEATKKYKPLLTKAVENAETAAKDFLDAIEHTADRREQERFLRTGLQKSMKQFSNKRIKLTQHASLGGPGDQGQGGFTKEHIEQIEMYVDNGLKALKKPEDQRRPMDQRYIHMVKIVKNAIILMNKEIESGAAPYVHVRGQGISSLLPSPVTAAGVKNFAQGWIKGQNSNATVSGNLESGYRERSGHPQALDIRDKYIKMAAEHSSVRGKILWPRFFGQRREFNVENF